MPVQQARNASWVTRPEPDERLERLVQGSPRCSAACEAMRIQCPAGSPVAVPNGGVNEPGLSVQNRAVARSASRLARDCSSTATAWEWNADPGSVENGTVGAGSTSSVQRSRNGRTSAQYGSIAGR